MIESALPSSTLLPIALRHLLGYWFIVCFYLIGSLGEKDFVLFAAISPNS